MHNKEKSKSTSNLLKKSNPSSPVKNEFGESSEMDEKSPSNPTKHNSPTVHHRRRAKRSSSHHHSLLSTVSSVHELMSFVIYKDRPPQWLKQTDLYREYLNKSAQVHLEAQSSESHPQFHQPSHRKQRSNLHLYVQAGDSSSPTKTNGCISSNSSIKQENPQIASPTKKRKNSSSNRTKRQEQVLCKKILEENGSTPRRARRARSNSLENQEPIEKKESSSASSTTSSSSSSSSLSSQLDSSNASLSSIEHTSPSPTTTASHRSSPSECMRRSRTSPMRSYSPPIPTSTPQRRSTRLWAPSSFYINPMWILPTVSTSKRNESFCSTTESIKRPRRRCRS